MRPDCPRAPLAPLRLLCGAGSLGLALLAIFPAPTFRLWQLAILATEFGHLLAPAALLPLLVPGWRRTRLGRVGAGLSGAAALLFASCLARALPLAPGLPGQLAAAFGPPARPLARPAPLAAADLLRGVAHSAPEPRTLSFAVVGGQELQLDLYPARGVAGPAPLVVMIHGGAWEGGDKSELPPLNAYLSDRGYAVAALNYRLAPEHTFPAALEDIRAGIAYLKANAAELGLDPRRMALGGRSAGGHLALLAAYSAGDPDIRGVFSFYGPADLAYGYRNPTNPLVLDSQRVLRGFLGGSLDDLPEVYAAASPISYVGRETPPTLLIHGGRDELVRLRHAELLAARLAEAGRPHALLFLPWATHAADFNFSGPSGQLSTYAIEHFLAAVLAPTTGA